MPLGTASEKMRRIKRKSKKGGERKRERGVTVFSKSVLVVTDKGVFYDMNFIFQ